MAAAPAGAAPWAPGLVRPGGAPGPRGEAWEAAGIDGAGLGIRASRSIAAGELLLSVPLADCWPAAGAAAERLAATGAEPGEGELSEEALVALWLCEELRKGPASPFAGQTAALPAEFDTILQWTADESAELSGSCFHAAATGLRDETDAEWKAIISSPGWSSWLAGRPELDAAKFQWAKAAVLSRQVEVGTEGQLPEGAKVVVPVFDLLNHDASGEPNCEFQVEQVEGASETSPCMVVRAARAIAAGDELRISYGPLPSASLLISHGFVTEDNPFDCVEVLFTFAVPPERRPWLRGLEAAAEGVSSWGVAPFEVVVDGGDDADAAFEYSMRHELTRANPLPPTLLGAVRLQVFLAGELPPLDAGTPEGLCAPPGALAAPRERLAVERLAQILRGLLAAHSTTVEADAELLRSPAALPTRRRMAVSVRLAEKEILAAALSELGS